MWHGAIAGRFALSTAQRLTLRGSRYKIMGSGMSVSKMRSDSFFHEDLFWFHEQMHMIGHEDIGLKASSALTLCVLQAVEEDLVSEQAKEKKSAGGCSLVE